MEPTRIEAIRKGEQFYQGKPCIHGHGTLRYSTSALCVTCGRDRVREQKRRERARIKALREEGGND